MDEPFGAIDPINRERLQNEFLRLQAELRKTIVFVTHDIDEAIKMGDRIAILQEGGRLAQYATPAELLMSPASEFVEDFVGADRALKRLALQRVRDIDLWTAADRPRRRAHREVRREIADADLEIPLLVDENAHPIGWLSERGLSGERVREELRSRAEPIVELDDILRDALSDLLAARHAVRPGGRRPGPAVVACCRSRLISSALAAATRPVPDVRRTLALVSRRHRWRSDASSSASAAATTASANNGFCPDWIADNFDRYVDPFFEHVYLTVVPVAIGFVIALTLGLLAHRRRVLVGPLTAITTAPVHDPQPRVLPAPAADHRPRQHDRARRAHRLHAGDHLPQRHHRAGQRPGGDRSTPPRAWA